MYLLIRAAYLLFGSLPLTLLQGLGSFIGRICYYLLPGRRKAAFINARITGAENPAAVAKESFRHTFMTYMESFYTGRIDSSFIDSMVDVEYTSGTPYETRGYFVVSAHFGAWELAPVIINKKLKQGGAMVARRLKDKRVDEFVMKQRSTEGVEYIHHRGAAEEMRKYMDKNLNIGVLLDHSSMAKDSLKVPFFGVETTFMKAVPLLSVRKNYPVLPVFLLREKKGFKLIVYPPIWPDESLKPRDRALRLAAQINEVYEDIIRQYPEQWYLIHKRFKRTAGPDGKLNISLY